MKNTNVMAEVENFVVEVGVSADNTATELKQETVNFVTELGAELDKWAQSIDRESKAIAEGFKAESKKLSDKNSRNIAEMAKKMEFSQRAAISGIFMMLQIALLVLTSYWLAGKALDALSGAELTGTLRVGGAEVLCRFCELVRTFDMNVMTATADVLGPVKNWLLK